MAQALGTASKGAAGVCAQVRTTAVGRDQKPSRQLRVLGQQRVEVRPDHNGAAQAFSLVGGDSLPGHQAVCWAGSVSMLGRCSTGTACGTGLPDVCCFTVVA